MSNASEQNATNSTVGLIRQLNKVLQKQRLLYFLGGIFATLAILLSVWIGMSLLAQVLILPIWFKVTLLVSVLLVTVTGFYKFAVRKLFYGSIESVALSIEEKNHDLKGRLIAAIQFARKAKQQGFSHELISEVEKQAIAKSGLINFSEVITFYPLIKAGRLFAGSVLLALALLIIAPGFFNYAYEVYSNPTTKIAPPIAYELSTFPGTTEWVKYRDIEFGGIIKGLRLPQEAVIHQRLAGGSWQKTKIDIKSNTRFAYEGGDSLTFSMKIRQVKRSFDYFIEAGELKTDIQRIDIVDRPRVTGIKLSLFYPEYTGLAPITIDENNGSFSAVVGSRVSMTVETNLSVEKADLVFDDDSRLPLKVEGKTGEVAMVVEQSRVYHIELVDHLGELNPDPIEYYLTALPDEYPSIDVIKPGFDANLSDEMILPLMVRIFDDYGFSSLVMKYILFSQGRTSEENVVVLHFSDRIKTEGDVSFNWDMDRLNMFPGDYVTYYFEVADNDVISGPKITKSRQYVARVPSLEEIIAQTEEQSIQRIEDTEELVKKGKELIERMKNATRKLEANAKQSSESEWQQKKELESIAKSGQQMMDKVQDIAKDFEKSLEQIQENALMSREILEKLAELQKLFEEVATQEMRDAQKKMMEQMDKMSPEELEQAMKDYEMNQEEMLQRLERTLALLKKMQVEQKMEAMIRKAEDLLKQQSRTNDETEKSNSESLPKLSETEDQTKKDLESLKQDAEELSEMMKDAKMDQIPEAQKFTEAVKKSDADKDMKKMSKSLKNKQKQKANKQGSSAKNKLMDMLNQMQQMQMAINKDAEDEMQKAMRRAIEHANRLSTDQESLLGNLQSVDPASVIIREFAEPQNDLSKSCKGLARAIQELGQASPFVAAELQSLVRKAIEEMNFATTDLDAKKGGSAAQSQIESMYNLNRTAIRLMESMNNQNQCNNGGSCDKNLASMESLSKKQNKLNKKSKGMCDKPGQSGKNKPGQANRQDSRSQIKRMAGEQGSIRKSLEQLEKEFGGSRQVLGRLSDIIKEMRKVEEAMASGEVGPETTERQLKIYSRMLEASRSLQRKDFSEKRQANSAENNMAWTPPPLPQNLLDEKVKFEDRLRQFLGDDYPPQYLEQIKAYFRALLNSETENSGKALPSN